MKIGILTYHRANNYGAYLQAYALAMKLRDLGLCAEIIDYDMKCAEEHYKVHNRNPVRRYQENARRKMFLRAQAALPLSESRCVSDSMYDFETFIRGKYDAIIAGSDEIWKTDSFRGFPTPYWLSDGCGYQRFSYAASSRSDFSGLRPQELETIQNALQRFSIIGVRDAYTYHELRRMLGSNARLMLCCDPVFLYDFHPDGKRGKAILKQKFGVNTEKPLLGAMVNDAQFAREISDGLRGQYELVSIFRQWPGFKKTAQLTPFEWVDVIAALDVLVSNYFHGICFAILSGTYFVAVDSRERDMQKGKLYDLLSRNGCLDSFLHAFEAGYAEKAVALCKMAGPVSYTDTVERERQLGEAFFGRFLEVL